MSPYVARFCVNPEDGLEAFDEGVELRPVAPVQELVVSEVGG